MCVPLPVHLPSKVGGGYRWTLGASRTAGLVLLRCAGIEHWDINVAELLRFHIFGNDGIDFFIGRPDIFQADFAAVCNAEYVVFNIETDAACQRVGNDQRRRSEESLFRIRMDTAVEVAVA